MPTSQKMVTIPATIYPGVFDREYQVKIEVGGEPIYLTASEDFVVPDTTPTETGVTGRLKVDIVGFTKEGKAILALPGEVHGGTSRTTADRQLLQVA